MTISLKTLKTTQDFNKIIIHRLNGTTRGLGYWAAYDYAKKHEPSLLHK